MDASLAAPPEPVTTRPSRTSVLRTVSACEWRLARGDLGWWATVALAAACVAYASFNGHARVAERRRAVAEAFKDESRRLDSLTKLLGRIERGEVPPPDAPYRDPRNAIYVGRGQGAAVAYLPDAPLAAAAVGLSDLYPQVLKVSAGGKDTFLFVDDVENPSLLAAGSFDLAFAVVYVLPLLILAVGYDVLSDERERGTLSLTASTSAPLPTVLAGKLFVRVGGVTLAALLTSWALLTTWSSGGLAAMAGLTLAVLLYAAFWATVCLFVNAWGRDSAFNAVALVAAWGVLLVVGPAMANAAAQALYPAPARSELVLAVREAAVDAERDRDAAEARYREDHRTGTDAGADGRTRRTLEVTVAADARADTILADQESQILRQRRLAEQFAFLLPPCLLYDAVAELAGNGHTRWDDYLERVAAFHARWREFFVQKARAGEPLATADYVHFPRFDAIPNEFGPTRRSIARVAWSLGMVAAVTAAVALASVRRLSRPA
jgi:ABC-2 type transport system permease protein